jgi:hypothetical protein
LASHNDLLEHMYAQAATGRSAIRETDDPGLFSDVLLSTARPVMSDA